MSNEKGSEFIDENVGLLYYYFHKIAKSYTESQGWLKSKGATINP